MNRSDARKIVLSAIIMVSLSLVALIGSALISNYSRQEKTQNYFRQNMGHLIDADRFEAYEVPEAISDGSVSDFYIAYDMNRKVLGYVLTVRISTDQGELSSRMAISETGDRLLAIEVLDSSMQSLPSLNVMDALNGQLQGVRIPVALQLEYNSEELIYSEYPSVEGLHDGVFFAENDDYDNSGYKDYVEITVKDGRIISVNWDAEAKDGGKNRAQSSVDGEYNMPDGQQIWAAQSYSMENMLVKVQNLDKLAIKSDGYTEIVDGVDMKVNVFYRLAKECIENSRNNVIKEIPTEGERTEETGTEPSEAEELPSVSNDAEDASNFPGDEVSIPSDTAKVEIDNGGIEDGVVVPGEVGDNLIESVDGLPLSEIRTQILGVDSAPEFSATLVSAVNTGYKYIRDYVL